MSAWEREAKASCNGSNCWGHMINKEEKVHVKDHVIKN